MKSPGRLHTTVSHTHRRASQNAGAIHFPRYAPLRGGDNLEASWCSQAESNRFTQGLPNLRKPPAACAGLLRQNDAVLDPLDRIKDAPQLHGVYLHARLNILCQSTLGVHRQQE